jgi:hypothetical protein
MVKIALLGQQYSAQYKENPGALQGLEVLYCGSSLGEFRNKVIPAKPNAVVLDMGHLSDAPDQEVRELVDASGAELVMVTYTYARRALIKTLQNERTRVVQAPLSLALLRAHLGALIVRETFKSAPPPPVSTEAKAPVRRVGAEQLQSTAETLARLAVPLPPRYTAEQLGRLTEIASSVECECPNQLARIVTSLRAFEEYSRDCENRDDEDARMHALLYRKTGAARSVMEEALAALIRHERIEL